MCDPSIVFGDNGLERLFSRLGWRGILFLDFVLGAQLTFNEFTNFLVFIKPAGDVKFISVYIKRPAHVRLLIVIFLIVLEENERICVIVFRHN